MLRTILVDDEKIILDELQKALDGNPHLTIVGSYTDPVAALMEAKATKPDCAFLDIEMPEMTGIELAENLTSINPALETVFITAYNTYASQAFDVSALDYLLKPIRPERLNRAVEKIVNKLQSSLRTGPMPCIIRCFGAFEVYVGEQPVKWSRSKSREFIAYMLQNEGRWVSKYKLCEDQWSEYPPDQALAYLQTSVYRARKSLREAGCSQIDIRFSNDRYMIKVQDCDWDVPQFEQNYLWFCQTGSKSAALRATSFYRGEYLEGEDWLWADLIRENYICKYEKLHSENDYSG